jgi:hypothetical protein
MKFVSVLVKRSRLNGGNLRYSILPSNLFINWKEKANVNVPSV